ncbi:MAG: ribosome biogenesis GTPase YlqF [Candidatus Accumulibacter sp.]|nr:ribosome biogenesis GTPase YlqF [Accumulibacter sp.]
MAIQWFPGHMTSARRKAAESMAAIDVVIEVVDARLPEASTNPLVHELRRQRQRPCLKVLNKSDLADPAATREWIIWYSRQPDVRAVAVSSRNAGEVARLPGLCQGLAAHRNDDTKPLRMMIMGIPNVGKSTLMNALAGRRIAKVGDEPAVTRSQQNRQIGARQWITDTPGLMWPKIEHDSDGYMLAASHAIGRNAVIDEEVAIFLAELLLVRYPERLVERYGLTATGLDGVAVVEGIARRRGLRRRGDTPDLEKAALTLLQDYRDGKLGRISLETPLTRQAMLQGAGIRDQMSGIRDQGSGIRNSWALRAGEGGKTMRPPTFPRRRSRR